MSKSLPPARYSLGAYLAFAFSILSILLTVILTAVIERTASKQVASSIGSNLGELAHQTASRLDRSMSERYREVELMARRLGGSRDVAQVRRDLDTLQASYPYYAWIGVTDSAGKVLASTRGMLSGADVSKRPWFSNAQRGQHVGDVHEALLLAKLLGGGNGGEPLRFVDIAFPLTAADGTVTGVLGAHLSWDWARDIQRAVFVPVDRARDVVPLVVATSGTVLLGPQSVEGITLDLPSFRSASAGRSGYSIERWPDGRDYLVGYSRTLGHRSYPGLGWTVLVRQTLSEAYQPVRILQMRVFGGGLLIAVLFSLLGWYAAKVITRPLLELADFASGSKAGGGELVGSLGPYREVRRLGDAINTMLQNLQAQEADLRELNATLEARVEERTAALRGAFQEVKRNEQRVHTIIESAQDPFIGMDFQGRIVDWNSQAEKLFGWSRAEVLGKPLARTVLPARYSASAEKALREFHATGVATFINRPMERIMVDRSGREIPVEVKLGLVNTDELSFFSAFVHDISERKEGERLKNEFISTVSHELRTPLTAIYGSLSLLNSGMAGDLPPAAGQLIAMSNKSCERLVRLINDVLDVEKIDAGLLSYAMQRQPLLPLVEQALGDIAPYAQQHGVEAAILQPAATPQVRADADRIVQVLLNLLSNAVKYSPPEGKVEVAVVLADGMARVSVADSGAGIPPEFHSRVFERFAQADSSDRRQKGGTGLGLNICRSIVESHGGTIGFSSEPGVRTEFFFELPLA